jgi:hypothetical protein
MKKSLKFVCMVFLLFSVISFASFGASDPDLDRLDDVYNEVIVNGDKDYLSNFSADELAIIRNTIYAKRGYKFKRKEYQKYFGAKNWYKGTTNKQNILNRKEQKLVDIIVKYEKSMKSGEADNTIETDAEETNYINLD